MSFLFEIAPNLSDEVRLKILEAAPDILNTANIVLSEYQDTVKKALEQNREIADKILDYNHDIVRAMFISFHEASETLRVLLVAPNASFEERQFWSGELFKNLREMREFYNENKNFISELDKGNKNFIQNILKGAGLAAIFVIAIGGILAALAGGKSQLSNKD